MWVMFALAPSSLTNVLMIVPRAQLSRQLRFRALAAISVTMQVLQNLLTILFAALGFGPFSFVLPMPIAGGLVAAAVWWRFRPPWSARPMFRRWRYLIGDTSRLLAAELQRAILDQSDYILLGVFHSVALVGLYRFGFQFSIQALQLFSVNLMNVLFPALLKLNDKPQAQFQGFLKAQRILATIGVGSCFLQAAVAAPLTHLILPAKWIPSIPVMQILCIGMATRMVAGSSYALLKSQGRFRAILWSRWGFVVLQIIGLVCVLFSGGEIVAVALVVAIVSTLTGAVSFYVGIRQFGAGWSQVGAVLLPPVISAAVAVGVAWLIAQYLDRLGYGHLVQLIEILMVSVSLGVFFLRTFQRPVWDDLWARVWRLLPARISR
jgi:PST family polysaccharide transporter